LLDGDCIEVMASLKTGSVDAIVTDPPYGLEFMGKAWDRFRVDDPGTGRHRGKHAGSHGKVTQGGRGVSHPARANVAYGGGKRHTTHRCVTCGKRDQFRKPHEPCGVGDWRKELIDPHAAPPTSLAFQEWCRIWAGEARRVLKPGGHLLAFGGPRIWHRLVCGLEDAGFEIRDSIMWLYGSGFPKSLNVSKAIDKAAGVEREDLGESQTHHGGGTNHVYAQDEWTKENFAKKARLTAPATPEAEQWDGWGTALKPAYEPIVVARKPFVDTVAGNVREYGTGAINVDQCRITPVEDGSYARNHSGDRGCRRKRSRGGVTDLRPGGGSASDKGRWPANVVLDEQAAADLDAQSGVLTSGFLAAGTEREGGGYRGGLGTRVRHGTHGDSGGASRFYYCAKTSRAEREAGLGSFDIGTADPYGEHRGRRMEEKRRLDGKPAKQARNHHPTVKPINLMRWLVRLVTPPGGLVLDPFLGSGSTGCAAVLEGFSFLGIEREPEYCRIADARCRFWSGHVGCDVKEVLDGERRAASRRRSGTEQPRPGRVQRRRRGGRR
jgi:site-specific DNA-methyltransferase (adenine-specific)